MITASCHCGDVRLTVRAPPDELTDCNCSICRRYGALWAYYPLDDVDAPADGTTECYEWDDRSIGFQRCHKCGCVTHWRPNDERNRMGVNARLFPPEILADVHLRHLDGAVTETYLD